MYSNDEDKTDGGWIYFEDGHSEYWNNLRLNSELEYRGLTLLKTQTELARKNLLDDWIRRLRSCSQKDTIFPLAGQDFRNKVIEFIRKDKAKMGSKDKNG